MKQILEATAAQIQQLRTAVARKRQQLLATRRRNQDEIKKLQERVADLRRDVAERRRYLVQRQSEYQAAQAEGRTRFEDQYDLQVVTTAICTFPNMQDVSIEYGDTPSDCLRNFTIGGMT
jgi:Skp family chaperone for outer membrane proteins